VRLATSSNLRNRAGVPPESSVEIGRPADKPRVHRSGSLRSTSMRSEWAQRKASGAVARVAHGICGAAPVPPHRRNRYGGGSVRPHAPMANEAGNRLAIARAHRGGSGRGQGERPSIGRKPGGMARPPLAPLAEAREAYARPSCRDGLSGRSCFHRSVARVQRHRRNGARILHSDSDALRRSLWRAMV
jgi:hypothetical protein